MSSSPTSTVRERGFALLALLAVIGAGSMLLLVAVQRLVPPQAQQVRVAAGNLATCVGAAELAFRRNGAFPTSFDLLAAAAGLAPTGAWRRDPFGAAQDFVWSRNGTRLQLRSRGQDRRANTADDVVATVPAERLVRLRQRGRLRLLRALLTVSPHRLSGTMTAEDRSAMRAAMRELAIVQRLWLGADTTTRSLLTARRSVATNTITTLATNNGCAALPSALFGPSGLMASLGLPDTYARDGLGRNLARHPSLGVVARGNDRAGGTDDDM